MADSIILSDGTNDYEFVYDSSTQNDFKVHYGVRAEAGEPDPLWHRPDGAPPKLIRLKNQPRTVFLTQNVYGDDWNDVINTLAPIKRLVDGEDQQAARYHTHGDVSKVYLRIQLDGMTNYTDATVIYGDVDDSGSFYTPAAILNKRAFGVVVMLVVEPLGEGAAVSMRNDCPSSPHFLEDSDANGLADGYTSFGSPTTGLNHGKGLTGGKSQGITTGASSGVGFNMTNYVTAATSDPYVAYAWLSVNNTNNDTITITVQGASSTTLAQKSFDPTNPSGYDKTTIGPDGNTWYRYSFSDDGSPARAAANLRLRIGRESANATKATTFYVDNLFIMVGTTTIPDAWCSTSAIQNRYDPASTSAATEARINYIDVWGVPGDSNAVIDTTITNSGNGLIVSVNEDGKFPAADSYYWVDSANMSSGGGSNWVSTADANRSDGAYHRHSGGAGTDYTGGAFSEAQTEILVSGTVRIFALARMSDYSNTMNYAFAIGNEIIAGPEAAVLNLNTWELLDLGEFNGRGLVPLENDADHRIDFAIQGNYSAGTIDLDAVLLLPIDSLIISRPFTGTNVIISGVERKVAGLATTSFFSNDTVVRVAAHGEFWDIAPGNKMTRIVVNRYGANNAHTLTSSSTVSFKIIPRTRHLLGTV